MLRNDQRVLRLSFDNGGGWLWRRVRIRDVNEPVLRRR